MRAQDCASLVLGYSSFPLRGSLGFGEIKNPRSQMRDLGHPASYTLSPSPDPSLFPGRVA
jgi:hypothetical protein